MGTLSPQQLADLNAASALAWITLGGFVNENQRVMEFSNHRFLIDIYADKHPDIVAIKSAQVGFSVYAILSSLHELIYEERNILYALPTREIVQSFVVPKVNPIIESNPAISRHIGADAVALKKVGKRYVYFKGGFSEREAIAISVDTLVVDEYDRMPDQQIVNMFDSRLQAAEAPRRRRFSNPSGVGVGVDALYNDSDARHWFVKCPACNHEWYMDLEQGSDKNHYISQETKEYHCGSCHRILPDYARINGRWVQKYPSKTDRHGYWFSQLMAPWVTARRVLEQKAEMDTATFHSFVLGKAYTPSDLIVNRSTILRATAPSRISPTITAMGVDQKAGELHYVLLAPEGMFAHGTVGSWEEIEHLKLMHQAMLVMDAMPYPTMPKLLAEKYDDAYICFFRESKTMDTVKWDKSVVSVDRTRALDTIAAEISGAKLIFREHPSALEDFIRDFENLYRTTEEDEATGKQKILWQKKAGRESDYPFALLYARVGLSRLLVSGGGQLVEPGMQGGLILEGQTVEQTDTANLDGTVTVGMVSEMVQDALDGLPDSF